MAALPIAEPCSPPADTAGTAFPVVFFDGICGLCNRTIDFIFAHDRKQIFRAAPLQGETAAATLPASDTRQLTSVVVLTRRGAYRKSAALVRILTHLGGVWAAIGAVLWLIPRPLRDFGYDVVARNRYRWFGKKETCRLPRPGEAARLLP